MKAQKIRPLGQNILIEPIEAKTEQTTKSGFVVMNKEDKGSTATAKVVKLGDGISLPDGRTVPFKVKEGDTVMYRDYAGHEIELENGTKYKIITEQDIFAVVE